MSLKRRTQPIKKFFFLKSSKPSLTPPSICCSHYSYFSCWSNNEGPNLFPSRSSWVKHERRAHIPWLMQPRSGHFFTTGQFVPSSLHQLSRNVLLLVTDEEVENCFPKAPNAASYPRPKLTDSHQLSIWGVSQVSLLNDLKRVYKCYVSLFVDDMEFGKIALILI